MLKIIEPLRFEGMLVQPTGAVEHPIMGAIDLYHFNEPTLDGYTSSYWMANGAEADNDEHFALKFYLMPYFNLDRSSETKNMVGAYAMLTRQRAAAAVDAGPPPVRMVRASMHRNGRRFIRWGYSTRVCKLYTSIGVGADADLLTKLDSADISGVQSCIQPLGCKEDRPWKWRRDCTSHNCGTWKDKLVMFDCGAQVHGAEEDCSWPHPETPVSV